MIGEFYSDDEMERAIRAAANDGELLAELARHGERGRALLFRIVWNLVFLRYTAKRERKRGHRECASVSTLAPECHDRHMDAVEAVFADLLKHADRAIRSLEAWMVPRLNAVIIDEHRRQRGQRGAQQRPRLPLPAWLDAAIDGDPWLRTLTVEILTWVGVPVTASDGVWPLTSWAIRRAAATDSDQCTESEVAADVERVLTAMRNRPDWYLRNVEIPLGRKETSVIPRPRSDSDFRWESDDLALVLPYEVAETRLAELADLAIAAMRSRIARGDDVHKLVIDVIETVFNGGTDQAVDEILLDPDQVERIVRALLEILDEEG